MGSLPSVPDFPDFPGGTEPTAAEVTLFYNGGKDKYRVEKMLATGQQIWLNLGELIRNQVPDAAGRTIPPETMSGSYELRDLDHGLVGQLYEGKLVIDKTFGHAAYGCGSCCGYSQVQLTPSPFAGPPGIDNNDIIQATDPCNGQVVDVTYGGNSWQSSNTAVATLPTRTLHTVAVGNATGSALIQLTSPGPSHQGNCPIIKWATSQGVGVVSAVVTQQVSGTVSSDNAALASYRTATGTTNLGAIIGTGSPVQGCFTGNQITGTVIPSTYSGTISVHRWILADANYSNQTLMSTSANEDDTSSPGLRDDDPQSGGSAGKVYDLDAPGIGINQADGITYRYRGNFYAYAALPDGTRISPYYNYYVRISCKRTSSGYQFDSALPGDNQIAPGTTLTTWNFQ